MRRSSLLALCFLLCFFGYAQKMAVKKVELDAMGKELGTISQRRFNRGFHEVTWNAKELNNGFYTYRLTVQNKQGRTIQINKLVIK